MNLFELLFVVLLSIGWVFLGRYLKLGDLATIFLVFAPLGLLWSFILIGSFIGSFREIRHSLSSRPPCRRGSCRKKDYVLTSFGPHWAVFRCRCGDLYRSDARQFSLIQNDHSLMPYMERDPKGTWKPVTPSHTGV